MRAVKHLIYGGRGEPYVVGARRVRYLVGTRPIRTKYVDSPDVVTRNEALQVQYFERHVQRGQAVFDIGGHHGEYAVLLSALVGKQGRIVTFEPDRDALPVLRANLALNRMLNLVHVESCAVSDVDTPQTLYARHGNSKSSLARAGLGGDKREDDVERYEVPVVRLDSYVRASRLPAPAYIKVDVEGAEMHVLRGAPQVLRSETIILCELHPYAWSGFGTSFDELLRLASDAGRSIRYLDPAATIAAGPTYGTVVIE